MRKEYGKAVRQLFAARMQEVAPQFEAAKVKAACFWPGQRAWRWRVTDNIVCWIVLSPSQKDYDEFTVLVGWSTSGGYPALTMVPSFELPDAAKTEFAQAEYLARLPFLWGKVDSWWVVREFRMARTVEELQASIAPIAEADALRQAAPLVDDAIDKLVAFGLPYLADFAAVVTGRRRDPHPDTPA